MFVLALEGDWEHISDRTQDLGTWQQLTCLSNLQGYDPVKLTIKASGADCMVACIIPKGNMMASVVTFGFHWGNIKSPNWAEQSF